MILGHWELLNRVDELFPNQNPYKVGASSIDVRVGKEIMLEGGEKIVMDGYTEDFPWLMEPGQFLLVAMAEHTVVPDGLSCMFLLKSTQARLGMQHMFAGWVDPGWDGYLTMELKNVNQRTYIPLWCGMPIGQLIYMQTKGDGTYRGRYQGSEGVVSARKEIEYDAGS